MKWPNLKVLVNPKQEFKKKTEILFGAFLLSAIEFKIRPLVTQNFILFNFFHVGVILENRSRAVFERDGLIYFFAGLFLERCPMPKACLLQWLIEKSVSWVMFYSYILKSLVTGTHYYGSTEDLDRRLNDHNSGKVRYTKGKRPWSMIYSESYPTRSEAYRRELFFKSIDGYIFLKQKEFCSIWRGVRVVEGARLESVYT